MRSHASRQNESKSRKANSKRIFEFYKELEEFNDPTVEPGSCFAAVADGRGYTFHLRERSTDLVLSSPIQCTVSEQLDDPSFIKEWTDYMEMNKATNVEYYVTLQLGAEYERRKDRELAEELVRVA